MYIPRFFTLLLEQSQKGHHHVRNTRLYDGIFRFVMTHFRHTHGL